KRTSGTAQFGGVFCLRPGEGISRTVAFQRSGFFANRHHPGTGVSRFHNFHQSEDRVAEQQTNEMGIGEASLNRMEPTAARVVMPERYETAEPGAPLLPWADVSTR